MALEVGTRMIKPNGFYRPITTDDLLSGRIDRAVIRVRGSYVAWTKTWQGPGRPDYAAAHADLMDRKG